MKIIKILGMALLCLAPLRATSYAQSSGSIITVAGNGTAGFSGDGGTALSAQISGAESVAADSWGNFYIADTGNNRIRKVTPAGFISTVAGTATRGYSGDGGPAVSAELYTPTGVAVDSSGNLYIADFYYGHVRKVTPAGIISTVTDIAAAYKIAIDRWGNLYVVQNLLQGAPTEETSKVFRITPAGVKSVLAGGGTQPYQDGLPATSVILDWMTGIAIDPEGDVYIALASHGRIVKLMPDGALYTVAGGGDRYPEGDIPAYLAQMTPMGLAIDAHGNLYTADWDSSRVLKVTPLSVLSPVVGTGDVGYSGDDGPALLADLNGPIDVAFDWRGKLLISDRGNHRIRRVVVDPSSTATYFPQLAVGSGWKTLFTFTNVGTTSANGDLAIRDPQGNPLTVTGALTDSSGITHVFEAASFFSFDLPPGATIFLSATANAVKTGWAQLESTGGSIQGIVTYEYTGSASRECIVSVPQSQLIPVAVIPVYNDESAGKQLAYAIANPNSQEISVDLVLMAQDGTIVDDSLTVELRPREQKAGYLWQDLGLSEFKGSLVLRGQDGQTFAAFALLDKQGLLTAMPVIVP